MNTRSVPPPQGPGLERADAVAWFLGVGGAVALHRFGLGYPLAFRQRGDAAEYMRIAERFEGLGDALGYVGARSLGMPLVDFVLRPAGAQGASLVWARTVASFLLFFHLATLIAGMWLVRRRRWLPSPLAARALFVLLATCPVIVGHTTAPLTDTLAMDLSVLVVVALAAAEDAKGARAIGLGVAAGLTAAFAVLVRPSFLVPMLASSALLAAVVFVKRRTRAAFAPPTLASVVLAGVLAIVGQRCAGVYGSTCLQDPATFEPVKHAQMGLRGGRLLWYGTWPSNGEFPVVPDAILAPGLYEPCKLRRLAGTDDVSLSGCLLRRPHLVPVYVVKKWIGLFDHFRFQPYVEQLTPPWLRRLSRTYDAVAIGGLFFALVTVARQARAILRAAIDPVVLAYGVFLGGMLAEHTLLHVEDRFSIVLLPACMLFALRLLARSATLARAKETRHLVVLGGGAAIAIALFVIQILVWDQTKF